MRFKYTKDNEGNFKYKEEPLKKDGTLKAEYKDLPRLKLIHELESNWTQAFKTQIETALKQGLKTLETQ